MRYRQGTNTWFVQCESGETEIMLEQLLATLNEAGHVCRATGRGKTKFAKRPYMELTFQNRQAAAAAEQWLKDRLNQR